MGANIRALSLLNKLHAEHLCVVFISRTMPSVPDKLFQGTDVVFYFLLGYGCNISSFGAVCFWRFIFSDF